MVNIKNERLETPMYLSLGQAAKEVGKSKATISKALKSGKLSYVNKTSAGYEIDRAELHRVFPMETPQPLSVNDKKPINANTDMKALEREIEMLREMLDQANETVERERANADDWKSQAQAQTILLTDGREKQGRGFWPFKKTG